MQFEAVWHEQAGCPEMVWHALGLSQASLFVLPLHSQEPEEVLQVSVVLESDAQPLSLVHGADIKMEIDLDATLKDLQLDYIDS